MSQRGLFATALLVSLTAHGAAAWYWSAHHASEGAGEQGQTPVQLQVSLAAMPAAIPPAPEPAPRVVEPSPPVATQATPVEEPRPVSRASTRKPQPPQPQAANLPLSEAQPRMPALARAGDGAAPAPPAVDYEGLRESYRSRVMARIESFKHYPLAARRQRVEGSLEVDLNIGCDGAVASLNVEGGSGLLRNAAAKSVQRAAPLPPPPPHLNCPHRLQYAMTYRLH